jgi:molybdopterin-guanine dinucleotide biosynthesis protein A
MHPSPSQIVGLILSGGRSSRMGGRDKALMSLGGKSLLARGIDRLAPQVGEVIVNANSDAPAYAELGIPVVRDSIGGYSGPLAGIHAGLVWMQTNRPEASHMVTVPADTPFFPADLVKRFLAALPEDPRIRVAYSNEGLHPVVGLWPVSTAGIIEAALARGLHKATAFVKQQEAIEVFFPAIEIGAASVDPFFNVNRPEDLAAAKEILRASRAARP